MTNYLSVIYAAVAQQQRRLVQDQKVGGANPLGSKEEDRGFESRLEPYNGLR